MIVISLNISLDENKEELDELLKSEGPLIRLYSVNTELISVERTFYGKPVSVTPGSLFVLERNTKGKVYRKLMPKVLKDLGLTVARSKGAYMESFAKNCENSIYPGEICIKDKKIIAGYLASRRPPIYHSVIQVTKQFEEAVPGQCVTTSLEHHGIHISVEELAARIEHQCTNSSF